MARVNRYLITILFIIAAAAIFIGTTFIWISQDEERWIKQAMRQEKVTLGLSEEAIKAGEIIDSKEEAQTAADLIREHRRNIAPTYQELLSGGRYDPMNQKHLLYTQALNMENYLYMAVLALNIITAFAAVGAFMILTGVGFACIGTCFLLANSDRQGNRMK